MLIQSKKWRKKYEWDEFKVSKGKIWTGWIQNIIEKSLYVLVSTLVLLACGIQFQFCNISFTSYQFLVSFPLLPLVASPAKILPSMLQALTAFSERRTAWNSFCLLIVRSSFMKMPEPFSLNLAPMKRALARYVANFTKIGRGSRLPLSTEVA